MVKLLTEDDFRDDQCALSLVNKDLEKGVTKIHAAELSEKSSILSDSVSSSSESPSDDFDLSKKEINSKGSRSERVQRKGEQLESSEDKGSKYPISSSHNSHRSEAIPEL